MKEQKLIILNIVNILFWIIFIGLCIKTGSLITSFFVSLFINIEATKNLYMALNLNSLYNFSKTHYIVVVFTLILIHALKAYLAFLAIIIFKDFKFNNPFEINITLNISKMRTVAFITGLLALEASVYTGWLNKKGFSIAENWAAGELLFFAAVIYLIAEIFIKGNQIQTEHDLTV